MRSPGATFDLRAALSEEIRAAIEALDAEPLRPKMIRRCRVHVERARALARVGHSCAPGLAAVFNESARSLARALEQARESAALARAARTFAKKTDKKARVVLGAIADQFDAAWSASAPPDLTSVRAGLKDLFALAQVWPEASPRQIQKGAARIARRARQAQRRGHARRGEWHKRERDRLYAMALLGKSWPAQRRRKLCAELNDLLGREREALQLIERIKAEPTLAGEDRAQKRALKALDARCRALAKRADGLGSALHRGRA